MEINMRNIKVDVNKSKGKVFAYLKENYSERTVRKYILRERAITLGDLISETDSLMIFSILNKENKIAPQIPKATVTQQPEKKTQTTRRRRTRKQSVKKNTTTS